MPRSDCRACGLDSMDGQPCRECAPAGPLLDPDPAVRLRALAAATVDDRPKVMLAALRGGRLWSAPGPDGQDMGEPLLRWLVAHRPTLVFLRWLAEDSRYGRLAWPLLAHEEPTRTLQRVPEWLSTGADPAPLVTAWWGRVDLLAALAFRLGGAQVAPDVCERVLARYRPYDRWWARVAVGAGRRRPSSGAWLPPAEVLAAAARRRRWPVERIEPGGIVVCGFCGEALPGSGPCRWCGRDAPDDAALMPVVAYLKVREPCARCGVDRSDTAPVVCGGCGLDLAAGINAGPSPSGPSPG